MTNETTTENGNDFVGMANCFLCGEVKHLLMDRRLKKSLPRNAVYDKEPCSKCIEYMKQGIIFISVRPDETDENNPYRTGGFWVIKEEAVKQFMSGEILNTVLKKRVCFIEDDACLLIGLRKSKEEVTP